MMPLISSRMDELLAGTSNSSSFIATPGNLHKPVQVIAVTSGKGGVGKSTIAANVAISLAGQGQKVLLMDADLSLANLDVLLDIHPKYHLGHVISGEKRLDDVIVKGPGGVGIIPATSGVQKMAELSEAENAGLIRAFSELTQEVDTLVVDTAAGIGDSVVSFARAAREVLVVVCDEPASITDAYATIKVLSKDYGVEKFYVIANKTRSALHGRELFGKLSRVTERFLDKQLDYLGAVPVDDHLVRAVCQQKAVVEVFPRSKSALALKSIARKVTSLPKPQNLRGDLEFFVERLIKFSAVDGVKLV